MKDNIKTYINEIYFTALKKNYRIDKIIYNHIDEIWSIDLMDMSDYMISNNNGFMYIFVIIDNFSREAWCMPPLKKKKSSNKNR